MNTSWLKLNPKIRAALAGALALDAASVLASWDGAVTWHITIGVAISSAFTLVIGYLKGDDSP